MKYRLFSLSLVFLLILSLVACSSPEQESSSETSSDISQDVSESKKEEEPPIDGVVTSEIGSIIDFNGWWVAPDDSLGFYALHLEAGDFSGYDEDGNVIDTGFALYSEQDSLTGLPLIRINFETLGDYSSAGGNHENGLHIVKDEYWVQGTDNDRDLTYFESSPFGE